LFRSDEGVFRHVGNCPTPWPCFLIAVRNDVLENDAETIKTILQIINQETKNFKQIENIELQLSSRYHQKEEDVKEWLSLTEWSQNQLSNKLLNETQNQLFNLGLIENKLPSENILYNF